MPTHFSTQPAGAGGEARRVPERSEIAVGDTWDLAPLFADDAAWEEEFAAVSGEYSRIGQFRGRLAESPGVLRDALEWEKAIEMRLEQINQFASLRVSENSSDGAALAREARLQALLTRIGEAFAFVAPEIQSLEDETFAKWLEDPALEEWVIPLRKLRRRKPHTLSFPEERLLALGASALAGHHETFSQLTNVDMVFGMARDDEGREIELTQSSFSSLLVQRKPEVRREAFEKFYREFAGHRFTLASSLASSVRADVFLARARNFPSSLEAALFQDDVPVAVYDNLISTVRGRLDPLFRYFELRRRVLELDELHFQDTYVPLVQEIRTDIPWEDAAKNVLEALAPLGGEYCETLRHGLGAGRWCDRYENRGKRSGAFSYGTYQSPPYILMNYKRDVFSEMFTLAHEAGHSMHTWHSSRAQSFQNYHYPIFLAEVASTFNEILLTHHLLERADDPRMRILLLSRQIDEFRGTLFRQTMFAEFEKAIHEIEEAGEPLTLDSFRSTYRKLLEAHLARAVKIDDALELECLRIPHFYSAFYVYKYATGICAASALAGQVLQTGDPSRYFGFLKAGGKAFPLETLAEAGVDMTSPAPIEAALDLFSNRVEELAALLNASS